MIPRSVFKIRQAIVQVNHRRFERFLELLRLLTLVPVFEICVLGDAVLDDQVCNPVLQPCRPRQDAFDAGGVRHNDANCGKDDTRFGDIRVHSFEPVVGDLA